MNEEGRRKKEEGRRKKEEHLELWTLILSFQLMADAR
jgi:hypothetical protein